MTSHKPGTVRIIGGQWRRRLIKVPDLPGIRPTHDRIRETLFNWLMPYVEGAKCLDLFAGSGALGFEALSRGAGFVTFVDSNRAVIQQLKMSAETLGVSKDQYQILYGQCPSDNFPFAFDAYDIIFLDPPYQDNQLFSLAGWLESKAYLSSSALIYVEMEKSREPFSFSGWRLFKEGVTSRIRYCLFQREVSSR